MNTNNIKRYAPRARTAFIAAMTKRAALFGIRATSIPSMGIEPLEQKGDLALIGDRPFPASIIRPRAALVKKVEQMGFAQAMEQSAYSWFNRLCAIRYMELKGYLDHGRCVLSHPDQPGSFQILDDCLDIELEGLDKQRIAELKLDGSKDEELYRELLLAQCHALHQAMPFLFEAVDDATELLLPENLTKTDSLIRELVSAIPEEDWQDVEIIGWLYQFYISEKKDEVMGKVVKSEDIPAATQLFTPNWIVQYLVQNSVGRQWLQTYPDSMLRAKWDYYIEPVEQTPEVQAQLAAFTPDSVDPLSIKVLDPACGSGHILVEAYKLLKAIYEERGFRSRDIPQLILEHNLFGLDIDDRAGQLAGFALMMLAREDDRRIFAREVKLNVLSLQESSHLDFTNLWKALNLTSDWQRGQSQSLFDSEQCDLSSAQADNRYKLLKTTLERFTQAKTFGSLIEVPAEDGEQLGELLEQLRQLARVGDSMQKPVAEQLIPFVQQTWVLAQRYDAVVANPPYMGGSGMNAILKAFSKNNYPDTKSDLFAVFMERSFKLLNKNGTNAQVNMQSWMFSSSYAKYRLKIIKEKNIETLIQIGFNSFPSMNTKIVLATAFCISNKKIKGLKGRFVDLNSESPSADKQNVYIQRDPHSDKIVDQDEFLRIPDTPIAYWADFGKIFDRKLLSSEFESGGRCKTHNDEMYVRFHWEVKSNEIGINKKWMFYEKGGDFRRWYGNRFYVVDWSESARENYASHGGLTRPEYWGKPGITWSDIALVNGFRAKGTDSEYSSVSPTILPKNNKEMDLRILGLLNSNVCNWLLKAINPSIHANPGDILKLPAANIISEDSVSAAISISKNDWDSFEVSADFKKHPILNNVSKNLKTSLSELIKNFIANTKSLKEIEEKNNKEAIRHFELESHLSENVKIELVSLTGNPAYRYGSNNDEAKLENRFHSDIISEFVSYTIGCIVGRYSLDREGLVYAHAGNQGFAELVTEGAYKTFPADSDGILPLTDQEWFADDATNRLREFVHTVWGEQHLQENLNFVAESLCLSAIKPKRGESALDTIRRYLSTQFFQDHLKTYKKRPIYWLFSSGKHKAFECLVYLHRYHEGTLARMRTEYVIPLSAKFNTYASKLAMDMENETLTSEKKRLEKELATLHNQQAELATFDEKLRHHADQRINLDLDDGVKVNYSKFGDLLADAKMVTGEK